MERYTKPVMEIVTLDNEDIITSSYGNGCPANECSLYADTVYVDWLAEREQN